MSRSAPTARYKIQIYPNNTLGSPPEILEQTRNGVVDIAVPTSGQLDKYDKAFAALMLPFVFNDIQHARRAMDGPMLGWLSPVAEKVGLRNRRRVGIRLPPPDQQQAPDQYAGRREGIENPHAAGNPTVRRDGGAWRQCAEDRLPGTLSRAVAGRGRRRRKPDRHHRQRQILRGAKTSGDDASMSIRLSTRWSIWMPGRS